MKIRALSVISGLALGAAQAAQAGTSLWTGAGAGANWSEANNWASHTVPGYLDSLVFPGSVGGSLNNDLVAYTNSGIVFSNNASSFSLSGNAVTLSHYGQFTIAGVTNASANAQTCGLGLSLDWGNYLFDSPSGSLALNGALSASTGGIGYFGANLTSSSLTTDAAGLISGLGGAGVRYTGGTIAGLATVSGGTIGTYSGAAQVASGNVGTASADVVNYGLTAAPASGGRTTYGLIGSTGNTYANTILASVGYAGTIQLGTNATTGQLILGSAGGNWAGGIYLAGSPAAKAVQLTNAFLTAGPDSGAPTPGTVVLGVNGGSSAALEVYAAITNNPTGGAVSVVKTGPGVVFYGPAIKGSYTGGTYINQGGWQLNAGNDNCVSAGSYYISPNAGIYIRRSMTNDITISPGSGGPYAAAIKLENYTLSGTLTLAGAPVTNTPGNRIAMNNNPTLSGRITGTGTLEFQTAGSSAWACSLNNSSATATNDWTGGLMLSGTGANVTVRLGSANQLNGNNVTFLTMGKVYVFDINGKSELTGALITTNGAPTTACFVTNSSTTAATLTVGGRNASGTYYGLIADGGTARMLSLAKTGTGTQTFGGALTYSGATTVNGGKMVFAQGATFPGGSSVSVNSNATLDVSAICPITFSTLTMSNGTVTTALGTGAVGVTNLAAIGSTNYIQVTTLPAISAYPAQIPAIIYTNLAGDLNFGLLGLPSVLAGTPYAGYISNNVANNSVDLVLTAGPVGVYWSGAVNASWDLGTANWLTVGGAPTAYADGESVTFGDSTTAKSVNLAQAVAPLSMVVSNTGATPYLFSDGGAGMAITAPGTLTKQGTGTLIFDNAAANTFTSGITIAGGTVQFGNNDASGGLNTSPILNNGALVIARSDTVTFGSPIQGSGTVTLQGGGTITLKGANSYTNTTLVTGSTVLKAGNAAALGSTNGPTIISSGSTLDVGGFGLGSERVQVSGAGTAGQGAIDNSGAAQTYALASVTLTGDTTFGASSGRWDLRSPVTGATNAVLSTGGSPYNLTKVGSQSLLLVDAFVDPALNNIDIQAGTLGLQNATTGLGNPNGTVTVEGLGTFFTYALAQPLNKKIALSGALQHGSGTATIVGPVSLVGGGSQVYVSPGTTLNLNGPVSGSSLTMYAYPGSTTGSGTLNFAGTNSFADGLTVYQGTVNLNGNQAAVTGSTALQGGTMYVNSVLGGALNTAYGTSLGGTGVVLGAADVDGGFNPGSAPNIAGTFAAANGLTFEGDAVITFDLAAANTTGGNVNDYLIVTNDLNVNGNNMININLLAGSLQPGVYHLIKYTGNLNGTFGGAQTAAAISQTLMLDTSVAGEVNLIVTGSPDVLKWVSQSTNNWDNDAGSTNWLSVAGNTNAPFVGGNYVLFDDTLNVATNITIASGVVVLPAGLTNSSSVNNFSIGGSGSIGGGGKIVKRGSSTLILGTSNDVSGVTVSGGILSVTNVYALGRTNAPTVITNGGTLDVNGLNLSRYSLVISGSGAGNNGALVNNGASSQVNAVLNVAMAGDATIGGLTRWDLRATSATSSNAFLSTGGHAYNLTKAGTNQVWLVDAQLDPALANIDVTAGMLGIQSTTTAGNPANTITVYSNAVLSFYQASNVLAKTVVLNDGAAIDAGNASNVIGGRVTLNGNSYFTGSGTAVALTNVVSGSGSIIKTNGSSQLILTGANTYTGSTLVASGSLVLSGNGSIASSSAILLSNATLDVSSRSDKTLTLAAGQALETLTNGTVSGSLTGSAGSTVSPGGAGRGTLTVTNAVVLQGTSRMDIDAAAHTNDLLTCTGGITFGGTLNVSVITGAPAAGDKFKLFKAGSYAGNFAATNLPALGTGLGWTWDATAGTLAVVQTVNLAPTNIVCSVSGDQLTLSWPADHVGWRLQVQTNSIETGLSGNWADVPGSSAVSSMSFPVVPTNGAVFYRMVH
jgi:autotransporter-associated beta strand protein